MATKTSKASAAPAAAPIEPPPAPPLGAEDQAVSEDAGESKPAAAPATEFVNITRFETFKSDADVPMVRCYVSPADAAALKEGTPMMFKLLSGTSTELDGQTFPVEVLRSDNFSITCTIAGTTNLSGATGTGTFAAPAPVAHPPITSFRSVWVFHERVALAKLQTGFVIVPNADADQMIADGDACEPADLSIGGPFIAPKPAPPPPPPPSPSPGPEDGDGNGDDSGTEEKHEGA